ncbi:hypothetical protein AVEN_70052-1 [Araneus ventricosus]|uniref:Uncharacterized protein n=1 Tax=Araneus ventricosus TaxID=182803 RepID=A0A4Y2QG94_ARAVE|nr:hypothetical protein AVEN_11246-1 [Araneus ventricosus]GBN62057.1 hypothetical protein AVEN_70052-1 [Araneus ventricosus]
MVVEVFVPSVNQSIESSMKEIRVQDAEALNGGVLNNDIDSEMATWQVLLQRFEEVKITWCEIRAAGRVFQSIPSETLFHTTCNRGCMSRALTCNNKTPFESSPGRFLKCLEQKVQRVAITGSIHGRSTRMEINQQQTLVVEKHCGHNFLRG